MAALHTHLGRIDRPSYVGNALYDTVGYVTRIWIDQEDLRDAIWFQLEIYPSAQLETATTKTFRIGLDRYTPVAIAQLHLLRDALRSRWEPGRQAGTELAVRVHFNFDEGVEQHTWVYWVGVIFQEGQINIASFYGEALSRRYSWCAQLAEDGGD